MPPVSRAAIFAVLALIASPAAAFHWEHPLTREQVIDRVIKDSRLEYYQKYGGLCACPYDIESDRKECGKKSAYSRIGGAEPKCYPGDVTPDDVHRWLEHHGFLNPWWE